TALDEARFCGRAAHVERDHIALIRLLAEKRRGEPASGRSRLKQTYRELARHAGRGGPPRGLHQIETTVEAALAKRVLQAGDIAVHEGLDVRVRGCRRTALVLAQLRHHLPGERHREGGELTRD